MLNVNPFRHLARLDRHRAVWVLAMTAVWWLGPSLTWNGVAPLASTTHRIWCLWAMAACWSAWDCRQATLEQADGHLHRMCMLAKRVWQGLARHGNLWWRRRLPFHWLLDEQPERANALCSGHGLQPLDPTADLHSPFPTWWASRDNVVVATHPSLGEPNTDQVPQRWRDWLGALRLLRWRQPVQHVWVVVEVAALLQPRPDLSLSTRQALEAMARQHTSFSCTLVVVGMETLPGWYDVITHARNPDQLLHWSCHGNELTEQLTNLEVSLRTLLTQYRQACLTSLSRCLNPQRRRNLWQAFSAMERLQPGCQQLLLNLGKLTKHCTGFHGVGCHPHASTNHHALAVTHQGSSTWHGTGRLFSNLNALARAPSRTKVFRTHTSTAYQWVVQHAVTPWALLALTLPLTFWQLERVWTLHQRLTPIMAQPITPTQPWREGTTLFRALTALTNAPSPAQSNLLDPWYVAHRGLSNAFHRWAQDRMMPELERLLMTSLAHPTHSAPTQAPDALAAYRALERHLWQPALANALMLHWHHLPHPVQTLQRHTVQYAMTHHALLAPLVTSTDLPLTTRILWQLDATTTTPVTRHAPAGWDVAPVPLLYTAAAWQTNVGQRIPDLCQRLAPDRSRCTRDVVRAYAQAYVDFWYQQLQALQHWPLPTILTAANLAEQLDATLQPEGPLFTLLTAAQTNLTPLSNDLRIFQTGYETQRQWRTMLNVGRPNDLKRYQTWSRAWQTWLLTLAQQPDDALFTQWGQGNLPQQWEHLHEPFDANPTLARWVDRFESASMAWLTQRMAERASSVWAHSVQPILEARAHHLFPIDPTSPNDMKRKDFTAIYGPNGLIDRFSQHYMNPLGQWVGPQFLWDPHLNDHHPFGPQMEGFLAHARLVRDVAFQHNHLTMPTHWSITSPTSTQSVTLSIGPQRWTADVNANTSTGWNVRWPTPPNLAVAPDNAQPLRGVRLTAHGTSGSDDTRTWTGAWAFWRMLADGAMKPNPEQPLNAFHAHWLLGDQRVDVQLSSAEPLAAWVIMELSRLTPPSNTRY